MSAKLLAESPGGAWRLGTGIAATFHVEITTRSGRFVARGVSVQEGVREAFAQGSTPEPIRIRSFGGSGRVVAVFHERVTGRGGDATDTTVLVVCGLGAGAVPACYVLRGGARRRFTPHFP